MTTIQKIKENLKCLPEKDIKIAENLLEKRDFIGLEELVNSDVEKTANKYFTALSALEETDSPTQEVINLEAEYQALKDLQSEVAPQAAAFKDELLDLDDDFIDDESLDYYA